MATFLAVLTLVTWPVVWLGFCVGTRFYRYVSGDLRRAKEAQQRRREADRAELEQKRASLETLRAVAADEAMNVDVRVGATSLCRELEKRVQELRRH